MSALNGWWDWTLFGIAVFFLLYAALVLLNMVAVVTRGVGISFSLFVIKIVLIVLIALVGYWILSHLGVL